MAAPRQSRVAWPSVSSVASELDDGTLQQIRGLVDQFGLALEDAAQASNVSVFAFALFRPFNVAGGITPTNVLIAISPTAGGVATVTWRDWRNNLPGPKTADLAVTVRQQLGWDQFEILSFDSVLLQQPSATRAPALHSIAKRCVDEVVRKAERQARIVRLNPVFEGRDFLMDEGLCFVLMPFREPFYRIYEEHIKPTLEAVGLRVMKADDLFTPTAIIEDIWELTNRSRLLVADVTGRNGNVFYELGVAHTVGKEVIILTQDENDIPFDLRHLRYFKYTDNEKGWQVLRGNLTRAAEAVLGR